jgi:hypothetical protein
MKLQTKSCFEKGISTPDSVFNSAAGHPPIPETASVGRVKLSRVLFFPIDL